MREDIGFRVIAFFLLLVAFSISGYFRSKANKGGDEISFEQEGKSIYWLRTILALVFYGAILVYLIYPPLLRWAQLPLPIWLRWLGLALMATMLPMIYWLFSSLGNNVTPTVVTRQEAQLVTSGPYRWVRHPLYTVGSLLLLGFSLMAANWFIAAGVVLVFIVLAARTPIEEAQLIEKFGEEYRQYMQRTGRYLPKLGS